MTCKDCIHYDVCQDLRYGDITDCDSQDCGGFFQNKADFVEAVRCKDCKKWTKEHTCKEFTADRSPLRGKITFITEPDDFCSYGERTIKE